MHMYTQRLGQSSLILWFTSLNAWVGFFLNLESEEKTPQTNPVFYLVNSVFCRII